MEIIYLKLFEKDIRNNVFFYINKNTSNNLVMHLYRNVFMNMWKNHLNIKQ